MFEHIKANDIEKGKKILSKWSVSAKEYALQLAVTYGHLEMVELLLNDGVNVNCRGCATLRVAAKYGHLEILKVLLDKGATDKDEALCLAAANNRIEVIKLLVAVGADVNFSQESPPISSPLQLAKEHDCMEAYNLLKDCGAKG